MTLNECDLIPGIIKVNDRFQSLGFFALFISRFALSGCLQQELAQLPTLRHAKAFTSTYSPPTLFYYSSCSLAYNAFAVVIVVGLLLISYTSFGNRWGDVLVGCNVVNSLHLILEGVIWLAIATAAELPQVVSPASFTYVFLLIAYCFLHRRYSCIWILTVVFVSSPMLHCSILIEPGSAPNVRRSQLGTSFLVLLMVEATDLLCVSLTQLFLLPSAIAIIIAATRTYRSLTYFASTRPITYDILPFNSSPYSLFFKLS